jgi:hypothetical protein
VFRSRSVAVWGGRCVNDRGGAIGGAVIDNDDLEVGVVGAPKRGIYTGRKEGTTKAAPSRARALKKQALPSSKSPRHSV